MGGIFSTVKNSITTHYLNCMSSHQSFFMDPDGTNFSESKKVDNVAHSFFRDSQFKSNVLLFDLMIFSNHFFNSFFMRLICCCHWPPWPCCVTQTCLPHFFSLKLPHPKSVYISIFIPTQRLHTVMNVNGRNFFHSQELNNCTLFELHVLTAFHFDQH
jgi:hypothetical protein